MIFKPESVFENILFTTVRIETEKGVGTGFIFEYRTDDDLYFFFVTNKHVIKNSDNGTLIFNKNEDDKPKYNDPVIFKYTEFESLWYLHPNEDIDIAIFPFASVLYEIEKKGVKIFFRSIPQNLIPTEKQLSTEIDAVEDIIIIGYPENIYDEKHLLPIVRRGITATPITVDYNGKPMFIIDASIFKGSSGSPVFLYNKGSYSPRGKGLVIGNRLLFLGIVARAYFRKDVGTIEVIEIPDGKAPIVEITEMLDLGIVFKANLIIELIEDFIKNKGTNPLTIKYYQRIK